MHMKTMAGLLASTVLAMPARAHADLNFDATTVKPDAGYGDPLPSGWYNVQIDESEMKPTSSGTGQMLKLRFSVLDGQYAGRKIFEQLNLKNDNPQTVEIARAQLSAICHAVGILKPAKSEELHGKPLKIKVGQKAASGGYDAGNKITSYKNINEQVDMAGGDAAAAAANGSPFGQGTTPPPAFTAAPAAAAVTEPAATAAPQPWATPTATPAPAPTAAAAPPPPPVAAAPAAPAPAHDPMAAATADGWAVHPSSPPHMYKGQEVLLIADVLAKYPAPAAPAAPAAPEVPAAPPAPTGDAATAPPPWANG